MAEKAQQVIEEISVFEKKGAVRRAMNRAKQLSDLKSGIAAGSQGRAQVRFPAGSRVAESMRQLDTGLKAAAEKGFESVEDMLKAAGKKPLPVVTVTRKLPAAMRFGLGPFGAGIMLGFDIGAKLADVISQKKLDEAGRKATRTIPARPDTPLVTIQPEVIPEVTVTAKRPIPKVTPAPRSFVASDLGFAETLTLPRIGDPRVSIKTPKITAPKLPSTKKPRVKLPGTIAGLVLLPGSGVGTGSASEPVPRSRLLGIGKPKLTTVTGGIGLPAGGAGVGAALLPQTQPTLAGAGCQPCPKPKRKKPRTVCYRKMVKEARLESNDKTYRWEKIKCR